MADLEAYWIHWKALIGMDQISKQDHLSQALDW